MRQRLSSGTDIAMHWMCDPAALPDGFGDPVKKDKWLSLVAEGRLLANCTGADGEVAIEVIVDEEPPEALMKRAKPVVKEALLRVPSGELRFGGAEWVYPQFSMSPDDPYSEGSIRIPPGNYSVAVYAIPQKRTDLPRFLKEAGGTVTLKDWDDYNNILSRGCLVYMSLPVVAAFGLAVAWPLWKWKGVLSVLGGFAAGIYLAIMIQKALLRRPRMVEAQRVRKLMEEADEKKSEELVVLRRLPADADLSGLKGAAYGDGVPFSERKRKKKSEG